VPWFWIINGIVAVWVSIKAEQKGRNGWLWFFYAIFVPWIIPVIHVSLIKPDWDSYAKKHHIQWCPYCRSEIDENAIVCKYCGRDIR